MTGDPFHFSGVIFALAEFQHGLPPPFSLKKAGGKTLFVWFVTIDMLIDICLKTLALQFSFGFGYKIWVRPELRVIKFH